MNVVTGITLFSCTCGTANATVIPSTNKIFINGFPVILECDINTNSFGGCNNTANPINVPIILFPPCAYPINKWLCVSTKLFVQNIPVILYESIGLNIYYGQITIIPGQLMKLIII